MAKGRSRQVDRLLEGDIHASGESYDIWQWMRDHDPVAEHCPASYGPLVSLTRYDDVRWAYSRPDLFSSRSGVLLRREHAGSDPGAGLTLALTDPPRHQDLRRLLSSSFDEGRARTLQDWIRSDVVSVLRDRAGGQPFDFVHDVAMRLSTLLIARLFEVGEPELDDFIQWTSEAFDSGRALTSHWRLMRLLVGLMHDAPRHPLSVVGALSCGRVGNALLTETEVLLNCENIVGASENAGLSMAAGIYAFLTNPAEWQSLQARRSLLRPAVEETLRWASSATHSMRTATMTVERHGVRIKEGSRVVLWTASANRDPRVFDDPESFRISRTPNRHLALGTGEHVCIGQTLARHQTRILLEELLEREAVVAPAGPVKRLASIAVGGPAKMPVTLIMEDTGVHPERRVRQANGSTYG